MKTNNPLLKKILIYLRGDYNSVIYRFTTIPLEKITLFLYRCFGYSWINYYSNRLNKFVIDNNRELKNGLGDGDIAGFNFLKKKGLKKNHIFLDYGCGFLRTASNLVPYLNKGNYTGFDISKERLSVGVSELTKLGISRDDYNIYLNKDNFLKEINEKKVFDFIFMNSVVTHMPLKDFKELLVSFYKFTNKNSKIYFTFLMSSKQKRIGVKDYYYTSDAIKNISE